MSRWMHEYAIVDEHSTKDGHCFGGVHECWPMKMYLRSSPSPDGGVGVTFIAARRRSVSAAESFASGVTRLKPLVNICGEGKAIPRKAAKTKVGAID